MEGIHLCGSWHHLWHGHRSSLVSFLLVFLDALASSKSKQLGWLVVTSDVALPPALGEVRQAGWRNCGTNQGGHWPALQGNRPSWHQGARAPRHPQRCSDRARDCTICPFPTGSIVLSRATHFLPLANPCCHRISLSNSHGTFTAPIPI